jgi:hypothetical protein
MPKESLPVDFLFRVRLFLAKFFFIMAPQFLICFDGTPIILFFYGTPSVVGFANFI